MYFRCVVVKRCTVCCGVAVYGVLLYNLLRCAAVLCRVCRWAVYKAQPSLLTTFEVVGLQCLQVGRERVALAFERVAAGTATADDKSILARMQKGGEARRLDGSGDLLLATLNPAWPFRNKDAKWSSDELLVLYQADQIRERMVRESPRLKKSGKYQLIAYIFCTVRQVRLLPASTDSLSWPLMASHGL